MIDSSPTEVEDPDEALVRRTMGGELDAFEILVERHRDMVFRIAARIVGHQEAEDVSQDALLRAFHRLDTFRGDSTFRPWLLRIVHNTALHALARRRSRPVTATFHDESPERPGHDVHRTPAHELEISERRERLRLKLSELRPQYRSVIVLRDLEGLSYEEIATVTEAPLGSVKTRLHRARAELIELLRNNTYDWELPE